MFDNNLDFDFDNELMEKFMPVSNDGDDMGCGSLSEAWMIAGM